MNALEIDDLSKSFGSFSLQNISLTVPMGSALGLIGENGAGKSTTISLILGALQRDGGEIRILGRNADENGVSVREDLGVVFDESCFPDGLNARQVDKVERCIYKNWDSRAFYEHIRRFDLPEAKPFKEYSRGMKMKLALAVALSHKAKLLLLDEHTAALDPKTAAKVLEITDKVIEENNLTAIMVTHNMNDAIKHGNRLIMMNDGKIIFDVYGEEKKNLTVEDLLRKFSENSGEAFADDRAILG